MGKTSWVLALAWAMAFVQPLTAGPQVLDQPTREAPQAKRLEIGSQTPVREVMPPYPRELSEAGVSGEVVICAIIDDKGNVNDRSCFIVRPLHPVLDRLVLEAVRQWKFKPYLYQGQPIPIPTFISVVFKSRTDGPGMPESEIRAPVEEALAEPLRNVLDRAAGYSEKLKAAALFYTCHEKTSELSRQVGEEETYVNCWVTAEQYVASARYRFPMLKGSTKATYVSDYQLVGNDGNIKERRWLLEEDGKRVAREAGLEKVPPLGAVLPILMPDRLLSREAQRSYSYTLGREDTVRGMKSYIIEINPRSGRKGDVKKGTIWVDKRDFRVLKIEVETRSLPGCEKILEECSENYLTPHFLFRHYYSIERHGLLFPDRSEIRVEYTGLVNPPKDTKLRIDLRYEKYRFFTVETDYEIIKRGLKASPTARLGAGIQSSYRGKSSVMGRR